MNKAKDNSKVDGKRFLREALAAEQEVLRLRFDLSSKSITHSGVLGEVNEDNFIDLLRRYLPKRYAVDHGIVIDCNGNTSDHIDVIIFDMQYTPTLLDQHAHRFVPAEAVYCVLEAKPSLSVAHLKYAGDKAASVRRLERTSVPIKHAGGEFPAKALFPITAGIVALSADWADGCASAAFADAVSTLKGEVALDCGIALNDRAFDTYDEKLRLSDVNGSLAVFLFGLLQRLQGLGSAPAVNWTRYGSSISNKA